MRQSRQTLAGGPAVLKKRQTSRPNFLPQDPKDVNARFGGINQNIRTLTAVPPSQLTAVANPAVVVEEEAEPTTLQTIVRTTPNALPTIIVTRPTAVAAPYAESEEETPVEAIPGPAETVGAGVGSSLVEEEKAPVGAGGTNEAEVPVGVEGALGVESGIPGLSEKESDVVLPENNRGVAIGIAFGVLALMAVLILGGFAIMKWRKKKRDSFFDQPPPPGIRRSTMLRPPGPAKTTTANTYMNEKMPDQNQYANYANLERGDNNSAGMRQSLGRWMQATASRFSTPTTEGGIVSMYRQNDGGSDIHPPPPPILRPGQGMR